MSEIAEKIDQAVLATLWLNRAVMDLEYRVEALEQNQNDAVVPPTPTTYPELVDVVQQLETRVQTVESALESIGLLVQ